MGAKENFMTERLKAPKKVVLGEEDVFEANGLIAYSDGDGNVVVNAPTGWTGEFAESRSVTEFPLGYDKVLPTGEPRHEEVVLTSS